MATNNSKLKTHDSRLKTHDLLVFKQEVDRILYRRAESRVEAADDAALPLHLQQHGLQLWRDLTARVPDETDMRAFVEHYHEYPALAHKLGKRILLHPLLEQ